VSISSPWGSSLGRGRARHTGLRLHGQAGKEVDNGGGEAAERGCKLTLRHNSRPHHIGLGRRYAAAHVL
jgi:hypothetical protein